MSVVAEKIELPPFIGPGAVLGGTPGSSFQPQHILYYELNVVKIGTDVDNWQYSYPLYGLYDGINIAQFIEMVRADDIPSLSPTSDDPVLPASITITEPCYVVMQITCNDSSLRFQDGVEAIKTADDHKPQYRHLAHVIKETGAVTFGKSTTNCRVIYFAVKSVQLDSDHPYNIYLQYYDPDAAKLQGVVLKIIDPAIKNRGGDDDLRVAMAQQRLQKAVSGRRARRKARNGRGRS